MCKEYFEGEAIMMGILVGAALMVVLAPKWALRK
jgi:hypothetical protein